MENNNFEMQKETKDKFRSLDNIKKIKIEELTKEEKSKLIHPENKEKVNLKQ